MQEIFNFSFFWSLFITVMQVIMSITAINCLLMGILRPYFAKKGQPSRFLISRPNRIDLQPSTECSAYASAFVLRHFGREATGMELYRKIPGKRRDGSVYPKGVKKLLSRQGLKAVYCTGNLNALKKEISSENGYNRKVSNADFRKLWNTSMSKMPLYRHTFFRISDSTYKDH